MTTANMYTYTYTHTHRYDPTASPEATLTLKHIRRNLTSQQFQSAHVHDDNGSSSISSSNTTGPPPPEEGIDRRLVETLELYSMRCNYSKELITQFYSELMEPNFPRDELDELDDWMYALTGGKDVFDGSNSSNTEDNNMEENGPCMDVILLAAASNYCSTRTHTSMSKDVSNTNTDNDALPPSNTIIAGVVFEYYPNANVGLISYMVVSRPFRQMEIMKAMHPLAIQAVKSLGIMYQHRRREQGESACTRTGTCSSRHAPNGLQAIFAETESYNVQNTSMEVIQCRHGILFALGYRWLDFPYEQPPLGDEKEGVNQLLLLVYQGPKDGYYYPSHHTMQTNPGTNSSWFPDFRVPIDIPYTFVRDFMMAVFGCDEGGQKKLETNNYYQMLVKYVLTHENVCVISPSLPWDLHTPSSSQEKTFNIVIVGAGIAGLVAAVEIATKATHQVNVTLVEANTHVGGRIRTVLTDGSKQYLNSDLIKQYESFYPWPVPLGAEFVHGIGSVLNHKIVENNIETEETFNLCEDECGRPQIPSLMNHHSYEHLKSRNDIDHVKVFGDGQLWSLRQGEEEIEEGERFPRLMKKAAHIWQTLGGECGLVRSNCHQFIPKDASVSNYVEEKMKFDSAEDIKSIKAIIDALYAKVAGTTIEYLGCNEASREDWNWEYGEQNFRTKDCFSDIIMHYMNEITKINESPSNAKVRVVTNTPISCIEPLNDGLYKGVKLSSSNGSEFIADKVVVAVPLSALKAKNISFLSDFKLDRKKESAISTVNMFSGMKVFALFKKDIDIFSCALLQTTELFFCPGEIFSQIWLRRDSTSYFVTGFVVANDHEEIGHFDNEQKCKEMFLEQLNRIWVGTEQVFVNREVPTCSSFAIYDWSEDRFISGIYSSPSTGAGWGAFDPTSLDTCRDYLGSPIRNTIFFAGEHTNENNCSTVQAAIESGIFATQNVLSSLSDGLDASID